MTTYGVRLRSQKKISYCANEPNSHFRTILEAGPRKAPLQATMARTAQRATIFYHTRTANRHANADKLLKKTRILCVNDLFLEHRVHIDVRRAEHLCLSTRRLSHA
jgi:hypothetical protein